MTRHEKAELHYKAHIEQFKIWIEGEAEGRIVACTTDTMVEIQRQAEPRDQIVAEPQSPEFLGWTVEEIAENIDA